MFRSAINRKRVSGKIPPPAEPSREDPPRAEPLREEPPRAEPPRAEPPRAEPPRAVATKDPDTFRTIQLKEPIRTRSLNSRSVMTNYNHLNIQPADITDCLDRLYVPLTKSADFTVLYTFSMNDSANRFAGMTAWEMLVLSIISCLREFGCKIVIYTTTPDRLNKEMPAKLAPHVAIRTYDPVKDNNNTTYITNFPSHEHFNNIGHARIFVVEDLLTETMKPVMYLDNDTIMLPQTPDLIMNATKPISCCLESNGSFDTEYSTHPLRTLQTVNNGVIIYPYNEFTLEFVRDTKAIYNDLKRSYKRFFNDLFAHSIACHKHNCLDTLSRPIINMNSPIPLIWHYYGFKYGHGKVTTPTFRNILLGKKFDGPLIPTT